MMAAAERAALPADEAPGVVATAEMIDRWLACARPGDEFVYATRCWLLPNDAGAKRVRELAAQGMVHPKQRPIAGRPERNYVIERSSLREPLRMHRPRTLRSYGDDVAAVNALFPLLARAARFGRPCPTDRALADRAGLTVEQVNNGFDALKAAGLIRVCGVKAPTLRQVTIVATGHRTGMIG